MKDANSTNFLFIKIITKADWQNAVSSNGLHVVLLNKCTNFRQYTVKSIYLGVNSCESHNNQFLTKLVTRCPVFQRFHLINGPWQKSTMFASKTLVEYLLRIVHYLSLSIHLYLIYNMDQLFFNALWSFLQILQQINVKKVHTV